MDRFYFLARQILALAWRQRWLIVAASWGLCLVGWAGVYSMPNTFEAGARLYVDTDAVLTPLLRGIAIDNGMANQIDLLQRTLLSRPNLEKLIATTDLNLQVTDPHQQERLIVDLARSIKVSSDGHNLFWISYRNVDPQRARDVVAALVNMFMEKATGSSRTDMVNAQKFLNQEIAEYEAKLRASDQRRADFRRKYMDILPLGDGGESRLDSARGAVGELELRLKEANAQRTGLQEELKKTPAVMPAAPQDPAAAAEARLTELRSRFTEDHPDIVMTRKLIATLRAAPKPPK